MTLDYTENSFYGCLYNPLDKNLLKKNPGLSVYSSDLRVVKYMICMYDPASPIVREFPEISSRKSMALKVAGIDRDEEPELAMGLTSLKTIGDEDEGQINYAQLVFNFIKDCYFPREWFMICCNEQMFWEYGERMLQPIDPKNTNIEKDFINALADKEKLATAQESVSRRISDLYRKMLGEPLEDGVVDKRKRRSRPQDFADMGGQ